MTDKKDKFPIKVDLESNELLVALSQVISLGEDTFIDKLIGKGITKEQALEQLIKGLEQLLKMQVEKDGKIGSKDYLLIYNKIKELKFKQDVNDRFNRIETGENLSNYAAKEKVYMLHQLGVLDYLQNFGKNNNSANAIGKLLSPILNELPGTLQRHINGYLNEQSYPTPKSHENLLNQIERLGFIKKR